MSDDAFEHDAERFQSATTPGGVTVVDAEAQYADLFAAALWEGGVSNDKRAELDAAAQRFRLPTHRVEQIERSLAAAHQTRGDLEEQAREDAEGHIAEHDSVIPFARADDPGMLALQKRIGVLEEQLYHFNQEKERNLDHIRALEKIVEQLQFALSSTLDDLDEAHTEIEKLRRASGSASEPPEPPATEEALEADDSGVPPPDHSLAQAKSGLYADAGWEVDGISLPQIAEKRHNPDEIYRQLLHEPSNA